MMSCIEKMMAVLIAVGILAVTALLIIYLERNIMYHPKKAKEYHIGYLNGMSDALKGSHPLSEDKGDSCEWYRGYIDGYEKHLPE